MIYIMRIIKKEIDPRSKEFKVRIQIDPYSDDCWNLFNILSRGDIIYGTCHRKI
jgi:stalled ribosome rescue protein Dom34